MKAIRNILAGNIYVSEKIMTQLLTQMKSPDAAFKTSPVDHLSDRELEVFRLIGRGFAPSDIARQLRLSVKTVGSHRERIKEKMGFKHGGELVRFAVLWTENMR